MDLAKNLVYYSSMNVNIHEAKTHLSKLLRRVAAGEEIVIAKSGRPVAKLIPLNSGASRVPGSAKDKVKIQDDFDAPLPKELQREFE